MKKSWMMQVQHSHIEVLPLSQSTWKTALHGRKNVVCESAGVMYAAAWELPCNDSAAGAMGEGYERWKWKDDGYGEKA